MVLSNPKATYRALLLDYDALLAASDAECSYCLSQREIQMLLAFVDYIGWKTRYIATETEIDQVLINHWSANLARKLMTGCCDDDQLHRFTEGGIYQSSDDGGTTWFDDPAGDPRNDGTAIPPLPGSASSAKRCAAADNVRDLFEQYRDNLITIVGDTPTIIAIIAGILGLIGTVLGLSAVGTAIGVLFLSMAAEMISIGGTGISGAITFTALETFRCLVYCRMNNDGELTYEAWQALLADIAAEFDGFAETFFYQTINGMGYIGVNNAATMGASTADDCGDCDCPATCSEKYEIWDHAPGGDTYGIIVGSGDNYLDVEFTHTHLTIKATDISQCCYVVSIEALSGIGVGTAFLPCGTDFEGSFTSATPVGQCCSYIECQTAEASGVVRITFSDCI